MNKPKILYAEDEPFLARIVCDGLIAANYDVLHIDDGATLMENFKDWQPQICVLDIMLPGVSGYDLSHEIRTLSSDIPIIFLSAKIQTEDIVKGFKSGGNDYLKKPFSIDELLVRIESLLTRFNTNNPVSTSPKDIYYFGNCSLDTVRHILTTSKGQFNLSYKETMLLEKLLLNTNKVVQRGMLLQQIWGNDDHYTSRSMDVHLTRIRKLITNEKNINIMNLRGIGYKLLLNTTESQ